MLAKRIPSTLFTLIVARQDKISTVLMKKTTKSVSGSADKDIIQTCVCMSGYYSVLKS